MKYLKRILTGVLSLALLAALQTNTLAAELTDSPQEEAALADDIEPQSYYNFASGTVQEVRNFVNPDETEDPDKKYVLIENAEGHTVNFFVTADTYFVTAKELTEGTFVTGYYDAFAPVLMIYPPQYTAAVLAVSLPEEQSVKVDFFDESLTSADNALKLNISDDTKIQLPDGNAFDGSIANRELVVLYDITTRSIPAQTPPISVTVLPEKKALPPALETPEENVTQEPPYMGPFTEIVVNGSPVDAPQPYINDGGVVMVPARAVSEALGFAVTWNNLTKTVMIGDHISLAMSGNDYAFLDGLSIQLETPPVLVEDRVYVPLSFIRDVLGIHNAYAFEGQIVIDNGEKLE